jgi:hypothetical protein
MTTKPIEKADAPVDHRPIDPPVWVSYTPLVVGAAIAWGVVYSLFAGRHTRFDELALGEETVTRLSFFGGQKIHCIGLGNDDEKCNQGAESRAMPNGVVLWLGNSQLHAINQAEPSDRTAAYIAHQALLADGIDLVANSLPNASLQEHYLVAESIRTRLPVRTLIVPAVFDDTRESGIREPVQPVFSEHETLVHLRETETGRRLIAEFEAAHAEAADDTNADMAALDETVQERSETFLNDWMDAHSSVWAARAEARGQIFNNLYLVRNSAFGINAQTVRPVIASRYSDNLQALRDMASLHARANIRVIIYIAPLRTDVTPPYIPEQYAQFQADVEQLCEETGAEFHNLGDIVPGEYWGVKASTAIGGVPEYDFMHFQEEGHQRLADAVVAAVRER